MFMKYPIYIILLGLVAFASYEGWKLYDLQKEQTELKEDFAELHLINHGLFNVEMWKEKAVGIFDAKIKNFKVDPKMYKDVNRQLRTYLNQVYDEYFASGTVVDDLIEEAEKSGKINKLFAKMIKGSAKDMLKGFDLKGKIPSIANQLTDEIKSNEHVIKGYLTAELDEMLFSEGDSKYVDPRVSLLKKYNVDSPEVASVDLKSQIIESEVGIKQKIRTIYLALIIALILAALTYKWIEFKALILSFTIISIVMLALGISLPMIDIDARLNSFNIDLLGEEMNFDEQVLYFQSKSILDVTDTLIKSRGLDTKIVGVLVFLFSIVFPFFKLLLSSLFLFVQRVRNSAFAKGVIFYLGKWSMADVFVVAIFMAYIGFYGIISSQLNDIAAGDSYTVETINYSRLSPGALFFTSYCIISIITSIIIDRFQGKNELNETGDLLT